MRPRWLPGFPNYDRAHPIVEVGPDIREEEFLRRFVQGHQPCVIRGLAKQWPALKRWNPDTLRQLVGDVPVGHGIGVRFQPLTEYGLDRLFTSPVQMSFGQFLSEVETRQRPYVQLGAEPLSSFQPLLEDLGEVTVVNLDLHPARLTDDRFFFSRAGYTDWHTHLADETLTIQLRSSKEMLLLPQDEKTFEAMWPVARRGVWQTPEPCWTEGFRQLIPFKAILEPGDALFLPVHWWHAAESTDDELNVTLAKVFRTPTEWMCDLRLPNVRSSLRLLSFFAILGAARSRSLLPIVNVTKFATSTLAGFPRALSRNKPPEVH
jgi:hypothetical protein